MHIERQKNLTFKETKGNMFPVVLDVRLVQSLFI